MTKYIVRITQEWSYDADCRREGLELLHTETFDKCGAMLLWSQNWYKTTGAYRRSYVERKREVRLKEYAAEEWKFDLNWTRTQPFDDPKYRENVIVEGWMNIVTEPWRHLIAETRCGLEDSVLCMEVFYPKSRPVRVVQHWLEVVLE